MEKQPTVYIMAKSSNATLYTGVTSNLLARTWQHREHIVEAFTQKYDVTKLVSVSYTHLDVYKRQIPSWSRTRTAARANSSEASPKYCSGGAS